MDPLSLISNIVAVVGAANSTFQYLKRLGQIRHAPEQLSQLMVELSDFLTVLTSVQRIASDLHQPDDQPHDEYLESLMTRAAICISQITELAEPGWNNSANLDDHSMKARWKLWLRTNNRKKLFADLRKVRQETAAVCRSKSIRFISE